MTLIPKPLKNTAGTRESLRWRWTQGGLKREGRDSLDFLETVLGVACCRSRSSEGVCFCLLACLLALSLYVDVAEAEGGAERSGRKIDVVAVPAWETGGAPPLAPRK